MALTKQFIEMQEAYEAKINELKQQLTEKDEYIKEQEFLEHKEKFYATQALKEDCELKIIELEKQLAEKEKEITYMTKQAKKFNNEAQKYYEDAYCNGFQNEKAIAELEKAEKVIEKYVNNIDDMNDCLYTIDQQIKELKGEPKC